VYGSEVKIYKELLFSCKNKLNDLAKIFGKKNKKMWFNFTPENKIV
jgi:translation initiation factor IF-1